MRGGTYYFTLFLFMLCIHSVYLFIFLGVCHLYHVFIDIGVWTDIYSAVFCIIVSFYFGGKPNKQCTYTLRVVITHGKTHVCFTMYNAQV